VHVDDSEAGVLHLEVQAHTATLAAPAPADARSDVHRRPIRRVHCLHEGYTHE